MNIHLSALGAAVCALACQSAVAHTVVFYSDFDSGLPTQLTPGAASITGVQGFAGLGHPGNQFSGSFLRSATANVVTLQLGGLPQHDALSLSVLFAAIDSLDGTGTFPSGDFLRVDVDGMTVFRETFANATDAQVQSYRPAPGAQLARKIDLGFCGPGGFCRDSAYDFGMEPAFQNIAHTASSVSISFVMEGVGVQSLNDESWAIDNLRVSVSSVPEPGTYAMLLAGLGLLAATRRRRRAD